MKTEIVCIIDKSGSMQNIRRDAIGGFNSFLKAQKEVPGEATITTVFFDHTYQKLMDNESLERASELTEKDYAPSGCTALLDAVGRTVDDIGKRLAKTKKNDRPDKVIVAILTDGYENASKDYKKADVTKKIKHQQEKYKWEFLFLAANQDAFDEASQFGIPQYNAFNFQADSAGTTKAYALMTRSVTSYRQSNDVDN